MSGEKKEGKVSKVAKVSLPHGWIVLHSKTYPNRTYYYNKITKCSTWKSPCEVSVPDKTSTPTATSKSSSSNKHNVKKLHNIKVSLNKSKIKKKEVIEKKTSPLLHKVNSDIEDYDEQDDCFDSILNRSNSLQEKNTDLHSSTNFEKRGTFKSIGEIDSSGIPTKKQNVQSDEVKKDKSNVNKASKNTLAASYFKKKSTNTSTDKIKEKLLPQYGKITKKSSSKIKLSSIRNLPKTNKEELLKQKEESKCPKEHFSEYDHQKIPKHKFDNSEHKTQKLEDSRNKFDECPSSNRVVFNNEIENKLDFSEEMDWEPYDEDLYLKNISKFRLEVNAGKKSSCEVFYGLNSNNIALPFQSNSGILIIDTNILISSLNFIKELRDTIILDLGYPIFYIPWRVLQELDHLKDFKNDSGNKDLQSSARKAISYLNENFKSRHPRFYGQSYEDFIQHVGKDSAPDDEILQTCLRIKSLCSNKKVILLTNDKNLESKAIVSNMEASSKERFQNKYLSFSAEKTLSCDNSVSKENNDNLMCIDNTYCELKNTLKEFLSLVLETEMKMAFGKDWIKICVRKPPWTLRDILDCFKKHWRSVFFLVFTKQVLYSVEELYLRLQKAESNIKETLCDTIALAEKLVNDIKISLKEHRPYTDSVEMVLNKLSGFSQVLNEDSGIQINSSSISSHADLSYSVQNANTSYSSDHQTVLSDSFNEDFNQVKDLFRFIWDSLKNLCGTLSDLVCSPVTSNNISALETRMKLMQRHNEVIELINFIQSVFKLSPQEINETHPAISQLSCFLIQSLPMMETKVQMKLPKCLAVFFSDSDGRELLSRSLVDFRDFSESLSQAIEFIDRSCSTT